MMPLPLFMGKSTGSTAALAQKKLSPKEKKYVAHIERALASFDQVKEWADYIAFLSRLQKSLDSNPAPGENHWVPHGFEISKTLAKCMSPKLPGGVHLKAIDVYKSVFDILGPDQLSQQVQIWLPGILPLMSFASISVKPSLIDLYRKYICAIDSNYLRTVFKAILLSLLPALDDTTSEFFDSVLGLIDTFKTNLHNDIHFWQCLFLCIITSADKRSGAMEYCFKRLPDFNVSVSASTSSDPLDQRDSAVATFTSVSASRDNVLKALPEQSRDCVAPEPGLLIRALSEGLRDENLLVQRGFFDLLLSKLRLDSGVFQVLANDKDRQLLILSAAGTVHRRDMSLNRRLWNWLLGPETANVTPMTTPNTSAHIEDNGKGELISRSQYFEKYGYKFFLGVINALINGTAEPSVPVYKQNIQACRIGVAIMDRWEIGQLIIPKVFIPILKATKKVHDDGTPEEFADVLKSASGLFDGVETITIWADIYLLIKQSKWNLVLFILKNFHVEEEEMIVTHVPLSTLALFALHPETDDGSWQTLLKFLLDLIPQRALLPIDHADKKLLKDDLYDDPKLAEEVLQKLDKYYGLEEDVDPSSERPYNAADLSALYIGFASCLAAKALADGKSVSFYHLCDNLTTISDTVPSGDTIWEGKSLLNGIRSLNTDNLTDSDIPTAFGIAIIFQDLVKDLPELEKSYVLKVTLTLLWMCLINPSGKYQVEAARKIWELEMYVDSHYIEAGLSSLFLQSEEATRIRAFNILWAQSASFNEADAILSRPLYLILDDLDSETNAYSVLISKWLQDVYVAGTLNRIFKICCAGLLTRNKFIATGKYANNEIDDFGQFGYQLRTLYNLLTVSPTTILPVFSSELCVIENDAEMNIINANKWNASTYKSLVLAVLQKFLLTEPPTGLVSEDFQEYCYCVKGSLDLIGLLVDSTEDDFDSIASTLTTVAQWKIDGDRNHELIACYLNTLTKLMKISSKKQTPLSLFKSTTFGAKSSKFEDFVCNGLTNSSSAIELQSWMELILQTSEYFSELIFCSTIGITDCVCNKVEELFKVDQEYLTGKDRQNDGPKDVDDSICELVGGLQSLLGRSHKYLGYLLSGSFAYTNTVSPGGVNKDSSGFFGSMIQGVFQVEAPTDKDQLQRRKLTLFRALKHAVTTNYRIWVWADEHSKVKAESRKSSLVGNAISSEVIDEEKPPFLEFSQSVKYNASKLKFRSKKLLESIYSIEPLETLETLIDCYQSRSSDDQYSAFKIVHVLDSSKQQTTLPYIFDSLDSRVNYTGLDAEKRSSLITGLSPDNIASFLVDYSKTLGNDVLEDSSADITKFLKDVCSNSTCYKAVYPEILKFSAIVFNKMAQTSFGEQRKVKKESVDIFTRLLNTSVSSKYIQYDDGSVDIDDSIEPAPADTSMANSLTLTKRIIVRKDLCEALVDIIPMISSIVSDADKRTVVLTTIVTSVASPLARHQIAGNTPASVVDLFKVLGSNKEVGALKVWRSLIFDIMSGPQFFQLDIMANPGWNDVFQSWILSDQEKFSELVAKIVSYTTANTNIFNWSDSETDAGSKDLKRIAYLLLICPHDTFINNEPKLQQNIIDIFASTTTGFLMPYLFMVIRSMALKFSQVHLQTFWPTVYTELESVFQQLLEKLVELKVDNDVIGVDTKEKPTSTSDFDGVLILQACKLLDYLLVLGLEEFQLDEWLFVNDNSDVVYGRGRAPVLSLIDRIASMKNLKVASTSNPVQITSSDMEAPKRRPLLLGIKSVDDAFELKQFFDKLSVCKYENDYDLKQIDWLCLRDDLLHDMF